MENRRGGRKLRAAWILTIMTTAMLVVPTLSTAICAAIGIAFTWNLIGAPTWASTISLVWAAYFSANVAEKHRSMMPDAEYNTLEMQQAPLREPEEEPIDGDLL